MNDLLCCHGDCHQGRACPLNTRNGGASIDTEADALAGPEQLQASLQSVLVWIVLAALLVAAGLFLAANWPVLWPLV